MGCLFFGIDGRLGCLSPCFARLIGNVYEGFHTLQEHSLYALACTRKFGGVVQLPQNQGSHGL